jgi:phytoene synthase
VIDRDLATCRDILARGSKSFAFAHRALPARMRDPVAAFYAFCRVSDDAVDESADPRASLEVLHRRLELAAAGTPEPDPVDRALAWVMREHGLPRRPIEALLEGYLWDVEKRRYETLSGTIAYSARVAASVGVAMTILMGVRERRTLARAADLGVAMQLTNIARDVGEDARNGRVYLPLEWLHEEGQDVDLLLREPRPSAGVRRVVRRLLDHAEVLYARAEAGIPELPRDCRVAIRAASAIYGDIGRVIRERGGDSVSSRAWTSGGRKAYLLVRALGDEAAASAPRSSDGPLEETAFLLDVDAPAGDARSSW